MEEAGAEAGTRAPHLPAGGAENMLVKGEAKNKRRMEKRPLSRDQEVPGDWRKDLGWFRGKIGSTVHSGNMAEKEKINKKEEGNRMRAETGGRVMSWLFKFKVT